MDGTVLVADDDPLVVSFRNIQHCRWLAPSQIIEYGNSSMEV